jgi:two-component system, OmpR family, sensor kinase
MHRVLQLRVVGGAVAAVTVTALAAPAFAEPWHLVLMLFLVLDTAALAVAVTLPAAKHRSERASRPVDLSAPADESLVLRAVCHEMRTPVSSLGSLTRALTGDCCAGTGDAAGRTGEPPEPLRRELAVVARDQAAHLADLLREATAITAGVTADKPGPPAPLGRLVAAASAAVPAGRLTVSLSPAAAARLVDRARGQQILTNLLHNAVRHGPAEAPVRLDAWADRRGLTMRVTDSGTLTPDLARALARRDPPAGMSGIGLWLVRRLVTADGGSVAARDLGDRGVAVEVRLPARRF